MQSFVKRPGKRPSGPVVKTSSTVRDMGSILGEGAKIPHALPAKNLNHETEVILQLI